MKKLLFSLVMMFALVIVAGTAMAASVVGDSQQPYQGGTYSYTLGGLVLTGPGTATVTYSGTGATITPSSIAVTAATTSLGFSVDYSATASSGNLKVTITYTGGCSNSITLAIAPVARPALALAVTTPATPVCQVTTGTSDNVPASSSGSNTIDFTVAATTTATGYNYDYTLNFSPATINSTAYTLSILSGGGTLSGNTVTGATSATSVIRVTFNTTPGALVSLVGTLAASPILHLSTAQGGGTVTGSLTTASATSTIGALPKIGSFTGLN